jgi:hypothetical protein
MVGLAVSNASSPVANNLVELAVTILQRIGRRRHAQRRKKVGGAASGWGGERERDEEEDCLGFIIIVQFTVTECSLHSVLSAHQPNGTL